VECAATLLRLGADPDALAFADGTALHSAAEAGNLHPLILLLSAGADPNARNDRHKTPLHFAAQTGKVDVIRPLVEAGAQLDLVTNQGYTALEIAERANHQEVVDLLKQLGAVALPEPMDRRLYNAVATGNNAEVEVLLKGGVSPNVKLGLRTAIGTAILQKNTGAAKLLLAAGADPLVRGFKGRNSVHTAAQFGNFDVLEVLLRQAVDVNAIDEEGRTPAHLAAIYSNPERVKCIQLLVQYGADLTIQDTFSKTPTAYLGGLSRILHSPESCVPREDARVSHAARESRLFARFLGKFRRTPAGE
jgi:ankyrin repeat protein